MQAHIQYCRHDTSAKICFTTCMSGQVVLIKVKQSSLEENVSLQKQKHFVGLTKPYFERNIP